MTLELASEAFHRMVNIEQIGLIQLEYHLDTLENEGGVQSFPAEKKLVVNRSHRT